MGAGEIRTRKERGGEIVTEQVLWTPESKVEALRSHASRGGAAKLPHRKWRSRLDQGPKGKRRPRPLRLQKSGDPSANWVQGKKRTIL